MALYSNGQQESIVGLHQVSKLYRGLEAVSQVSLTVLPGERVAFLGPSGSGKTTLLRLIAGTISPTAGSIHLAGRDVSSIGPGREMARLVGLIPQQFDLVPNLTALHNVLAARLGVWSTAKAMLSLLWPQEREFALEAMVRVGIAQRANIRASHLSGGEQQRVAIARVLVQDPVLLLADEPVSSLDPARASEIVGLLAGVASDAGKTLVASMHSVDLARRHFTRFVGLRNGAVQFDATPGSVSPAMLECLYELRGLRSDTLFTPAGGPTIG